MSAFGTAHSSLSAGGPVPIGRPIANTQLYVLDDQLELVGIGAPGELYIGGVGVGRGYWQRPDLTADRFVPDPYGSKAGARLYRTGDRARYRADGAIEFLGRVDYQVKLRGQRIELGEIETALRQHESVGEVIVTVRGSDEDDQRLVAYVVKAEDSADGDTLRRYLRERLPEYMVPAAFIFLEQMPLTRNGKVDRQALPDPALTDEPSKAPFEAPRTPLEALLAELWCESLKLTEVSVHANFFEVGGDSLKGAVFINKLQQRLGEVLYVVALFDAPTIAALATYLETKYPQGVARLCGGESTKAGATPAAPVSEADVVNLRATIARHERPRSLPSSSKNPSAIFILSPPRSGSTLLRVMLGGSPDLFAPPELELLSFATMSERRAALSGRNAFSLEGAIRGVMELHNCDASTAQALIEHDEAQQVPVQDFYRRLQQWCGARRLVDKTPVYALEPETLRRAEEYFENPLYVHLLRHPAAMINSFVEAKLDEVFFRYQHHHTTRELAELIWLLSQQNIQKFLREIPAARQHQVRFEELLQQPEAVARSLSQFLGVEFCEAMIEPYRDPKKRMTDGLHEVSRMHGDMKFFTHDRIDPQVAERWREQAELLPLADVTVALAAELGYVTQATEGKNTAIAVMPRTAHSKLPLSFAQQRLWFLDQLQTSSTLYNIAAARRLKGRLNVSALAQSLREIVRRHESLRTTFSVMDGEPVQVIAAADTLSLAETDLSHLPLTELETETQREVRAEAQRPFDLAQGPLFRARLLKLGAEEHVLLLTLHHIISDGWSIGILFRELAVLYNAFCAEEPAPLAELTVQYADYAAWQRHYLQGEVLERELEYWKEQLQGAPAVLELPTDRPRPVAQSYAGAVEKISLPEELSEKLKELSQREGVTLFMTLLAAFQVLLSRYSGQQDVVVGTPIAGRTRAEEEALIGLFVNTLALRVDLSGGPTFRQVLARVRETCLGAYAHQEIPFEKLVEELRPERSLRHSPLFQVFFQLNTPRESLALSDLSTSPFRHHHGKAKFDLTLALAERSDGLRGSLEYNSDLFDASTAERLVAHFTTMLQAAAAAPDTPIYGLPLLSATEQRQVLIDWNDTAREFALNEGVQQLFEQQVTRTPDAVALTSADETLTYGELNERANRLAHYLLQQGVGAESLVGILLDRSPEMVISLLATLKAGAVYLPLDPAYPIERLSFMVENAGVQMLLTREHLVERLPAFTGQRFCFEPESLQDFNSDNPQSIVSADNLAYVIYTSGSTGTPKGVGITRRALTNFLQAMLAGPGLRGDDVLLAVTTLSFDIAALELFLPLVVGARLVVVDRQVAADARQLTRTLEQEAATVMQATPSTWRMLVESGWRGDAGFKILCGGEALAGDLAEALLQGGAELWNLYGPTETTIWSTAERVESGSQLTIGRGVANTQVYVLDENLEPVAPRVAGELYIGGFGVARGYLGQAALTAERFVPDAWSGVAGGRVYRTGDVVRWGSDGRLEYLGRSDQQVKVRGHRIEPREVERALNDHERVRQSVVVARDGAHGEKQLVAYIVAEGAGELTASELREHARTRLPEYMVPNLFVALEQLPLTANGKVDTRKLPSPESGSNLATQNYTSPRTETERMLCGIWSNVLKIEQVGIHDNFFEVGGHSLLATQLVSQMREVFGVEIALRTIFETPTVAGLAQQIETARATEKELQAPAILPVSRDGNLPLAFAQQRLWFLDQLETSSSLYNIATARRLKGRLNVSALVQSLNEIVRRHESLRTTFALLEEQPLQLISEAADFNLTVLDLSQLGESEANAEAQRHANAEARQPFDLAQGPLFRARLLKLGAEEHVLLLTLHHIISDGWSIGILFRELAVLYNAFCAEEPAPLAELTVQYADYAAWQRHYLQGEVLERELEYWKEQLQGAPAVLELPTDRPRPAAQSYAGAVEKISLPEELSEKLKELSQREGVTLFMTLLAAFQVLLSRYSGQQDVVVGTPIAGRTRAEEEALIGLFVNTLALRVDLSGGATFRQVLARVRETCLGAYAHQEIPFEKLVEELRPERSLRHSPLFQVFFQLNTPRESLTLSGVKSEPFKHQNETAKFDLTLVLNDTSDGLVGNLEYSTDLFDSSTATRIVNHLSTILSAAVAAPETPLHALPLLTQSEHQQLLQEWNQTRRDFRLDQGVHGLFEQQVERTPEAIALICEDEFVSYRELNERANRFAHYLMKHGIGPESLVGVLLERSADMVVALLAVLKAGAAYLPLDTAFPAGRLSLMLEDARAEALLTHEKWLSLAPPTGIKLISLDGEREQIEQESAQNPVTPGTPANLAYAIYTSGSTGRPKGVEITRGALENSLRGMMECFPLDERDVFAAISTLCFDIAALELFVPLLFGARVLVVRRDVSLDPRQLAHALDNFGATIMEATPTSWRMLLEAGWSGKSGLRALCGGEVLTGELTEALLERGCKLWNLYGPTETTLWSTVEPVERGERVTIGRPVANARLYVVDACMEPVPVGLTGELYIGGEGVARGYMGDPGLTAARFVPDPWSGQVGARLYRTGDLVRWRADGRLEYQGRADQQVKIRGHRIEPAEVEAALNEHELVGMSVVVARDGGPGADQLLVAYIVPALATEENIELSRVLRQYLQQRVPDYMVPNLFVELAQLPRTPSGKVDRRALPEPPSYHAETADNYEAPRTPVEEMLCGIWAEVLRLDQVGINDNFFELRGHSLLATQLVSRLRKVFGVEIALRTIFETPTVAGLAQQIETTQAAEKGLQASPILRVSRDGDLPLSFAQQRLWFMDQLETGSPLYNIASARELKGPLNVSALAQSLTEIVRRHESLRTTFSMLEEQPLQVIAEPAEFNLSVLDLSELEEAERNAEAQRQANAEARQPFNLSEGPLFRARLLKLADEEHVLLLTMHHIIGDGWSLGILLRELAVLYNAFCAEEPAPLTELTVQSADYAAWQRNYLQGEVLAGEVAYWKGQLQGAPAVLELPTDRPRPAARSYEGAVEKFSLPEELSGKLKELSQREGVTLFMTLLAAFQVLLARYSGQKDVVVGTPIAGRTRTEGEAVIGLFVNTLALRVDVSGEPSFREVLARVRETCLGAYAHQEIPFEKLVQELRPERSLRHSPLFQVFFQLNTPRESLSLSGLESKPFKHQNETAKFDLTLALNDTSNGLLGRLEYSTDLFDPATARRLVTHFTTILDAAVAAPETPVHALPMLTKPERQQLLEEWNNTRRDFRLDQGIHGLFEQQVERTPEAIALICEDEFLSYRELNERANRLAHYLTKRGIGPESLVGVLLERSADMMVALLAVLKAGAAYLPLDTAYPAGRLSLMLEDAKAQAVLTHEEWISLAPAGIKVICLDGKREQIEQESPQNAFTAASSDNLAYAIYTSGSTGRPKGVVITRGAFENTLRAMMECFPLSESDVFAAISTLCFDIAALELFLPLLSGARLLVVSRAVAADPCQLADVLEKFDATIMEATPTSWRMLVESGWPGKTGFRALCGGEALTGELAEALLERGCVLWNLYGPTETTIWSAIEPVERDTRVTIGRAVANERLYVLDEWMEPVPIGVTGELYIGGAAVARGYVGDSALTAVRFVPDSWSGQVGARLYRTGDLVRWRTDGRLEYLGRADQQVKIRGHRIEPGEVEAVLNEHELVRAGVVVARQGAGPGADQQLIAYVVPAVASEEKRELVRVLRQHLQQRLPDYMVPNLFMELDQLPLAPSGKVNRRALPEPPSYCAETGEDYEAPRTKVEEVLCGIWAEVLRLDQVGINDNFFELGGHSLLATRLLACVQNAFEVRLPLRCVFEAPTVVGMAESLFNTSGERLRIEETAQILVQLSQISEEEAAAMLSMQLVG